MRRMVALVILSAITLCGCSTSSELKTGNETNNNQSNSADIDVNNTDDDTDNDGAPDIWELNNNFDPNVYNESFSITLKSEEVTEYNLVSMEVNAEIDYSQINKLDIQNMGSGDSYLVRPTLPGYLGSAYQLIAEGEIDALVTFRYNTDVYGEISESFQPCIYYVNQTNQLYEEVENQDVTTGSVKARVNKGGIYILLNKVEYEIIWSTS